MEPDDCPRQINDLDPLTLLALPHGCFATWYLCVQCRVSDAADGECRREKIINLGDWLRPKDPDLTFSRVRQPLSHFVFRLRCANCAGKPQVVDLMDSQVTRPSTYNVPVARYRVRLHGEGTPPDPYQDLIAPDWVRGARSSGGA